MVIDAHHHVWDLTVRDQPWLADPDRAAIRRNFGLDDLRPAAEAAGVRSTVLVQTVTEPGETPEMLALAAADPLVGAVVGWTDLTSPAVADELARIADRHLAGVRWFSPGLDVLPGLRALADAGLCCDLLIRPHQLPAATEAAAAVPGLTMVLDHMGIPPERTADLEPWTTSLRAFAAQPNTVCKLSGLVGLAPSVADTVLEAFGPDRVMFGSDWPVCLLAASYARVMELARASTARLSEAEREAVFAGTAARVYRINRTRPAPDAIR
jgi:L-fuconolactonase